MAKPKNDVPEKKKNIFIENDIIKKLASNI
jgi:hypothetical protein